MNKLCCFYSFGTILMLIGAAGIVILGGIFKPFILEPKINEGVKDGLTISYSTFSESDLEKFRLDMKDYDFYYFNITNFAQVNGHVFDYSVTAPPVPTVSEAGPYTYRYFENKEDIEVIQAPSGEELIRYRIWWHYNPVAGNNEQTDKICTINPLYMGGINSAWQQSYYAAAGADEYFLERQFFALLAPQAGSAVVPAALSQMISQSAIALFTVYIQAIVGTLMSPPLSLDIDTIMADWRIKNFNNGFYNVTGQPSFIGFELADHPATNNPYVPGATVTTRLFSASAQYSLRNTTGWSQWIDLLTDYSKGNTATANFAAFGNVVGPDIVADLVATGFYNVSTATAALPTMVPALFGRIATYAQALATVTPATAAASSPFTAFVFGGLYAGGLASAATYATWEDFAYTQLATSDFSNWAGKGNFLTVSAPIITPVTSPVAPLIYGADPNIRFYGLELKSYNLGAPTRQQMKNFWADWANNGTKLYAVSLGIGMVPTRSAALTSTELTVLGYLNTFGFAFNMTDPTTSRQQALRFIDYIGSILTTFVYPQLSAANTGLFTCRTPYQFTKGYTDLALKIKFPGYFNDQPANYTGAFRTLYTGKNNADIARFYYARNNVTSFRTLADLGRFTDCPINLATGLPVCHDIWSGPNYDDNGITVSIKDSSTFSFFGPFQEGETPRPLAAFNNDLLRTVNLTYEVDEDVKGITTRRYKLADEMLQKSSDNPANTVYRMTKAGVAPMKFANPLWGFTLSRPHFVDADPAIIATVNGLDQTHNSKYQTNVWIEPLTGAVMQGTKKLQGSFHMKAITFDDRLYGRLFATAGSEYYWPTFWANERGVLNDSQADDFKNSIYYYRDLANLLQPIGYGVGAGLFAIGLILMVLGCKAKSAAGSTQLKSSTTL